MTPAIGQAAGADAKPAPASGDMGDHAKAFAGLRDRAARAGFSLGTMTETDGECFYLLSRWGMTRTLPDLAGVARLLREMGVTE